MAQPFEPPSEETLRQVGQAMNELASTLVTWGQNVYHALCDIFSVIAADPGLRQLCDALAEVKCQIEELRNDPRVQNITSSNTIYD